MARTSNTHSVSIATASSSLQSAAAALSSGQWATFTMGGLNLSLLDVGNSHSINEFCARGHWDAVHKKIQYWGQGHETPNKLITWDDTTNQWSSQTNGAYTGGQTNLGHAYYHQALDPSSGDIYVRRYNSGAVHKKLYNGAWSTIASHHHTANQDAGALEWLAGLNGGIGGLVFGDVLSLETWNPNTNAWTLRSTSLTGLGNHHNWSASAGGFVYFGGGNGGTSSTVMYRLNSAGSISSMASTPITAAIWPENGDATVVAHPNGTDLLLFGAGPTTGNIYRYNAGTNSWGSPVGTMSLGSGNDQWFAVPISDYSVVLFVAQASSVSIPVCRIYKP